MATKASPKAKAAPAAVAKSTKVAAATKTVTKPLKAAAGERASVVTKPATKAKSASRATARVGVEQRRNYVEVAAFFIAERRGFAPGDAMADWLAAEAQVDQLIAEGKIGG